MCFFLQAAHPATRGHALSNPGSISINQRQAVGARLVARETAETCSGDVMCADAMEERASKTHAHGGRVVMLGAHGVHVAVDVRYGLSTASWCVAWA